MMCEHWQSIASVNGLSTKSLVAKMRLLHTMETVWTVVNQESVIGPIECECPLFRTLPTMQPR